MKGQKKADNPPTEILVVEDSRTQAEQLQFLLEQRNYAVTVATNGVDALEVMRQRRPALVITDIVMPKMDGYALCSAIKSDAALKDIPVVVVTSLSAMQDIAKSLECGADNFIRKPYDPKTLLARIDYTLLNRELRKSKKSKTGMEVILHGQKHFITSEREQIVDLLISAYEEAVQMNEELQDRTIQLAHASAEMETFSYSVSHDLRTPLRGIAGFSKLLLEDCAEQLDDKGKEYLQRVHAASIHMGKLIDGLLNLAHINRTVVAKDNVDLSRLAHAVAQGLRDSDPGRNVEFVIADKLTAEGDPDLMRVVIQNLLGNAWKYTSTHPTARIEFNTDPSSKGTTFFVKDDGVGFNMAYVNKLFGPFQRLHANNEFEGTGVGLATVRRILRRHGGDIWVQAEVEKGATFYFTIAKPFNGAKPSADAS